MFNNRRTLLPAPASLPSGTRKDNAMFAAKLLIIASLSILLGNPIRGLQPDATPWSLFGLLGFTLIGRPLSELAGWRGFALPRLQERYSALKSSLILTMLAHFFFNCSIVFLVQQFGLMPPMYLYIGGGGLMLVLMTWIIVYFDPQHFSRKKITP
ncbi:MAG TPA: hypothetical protein VLH85_00635 [Levilinea sp.]|nr:hypothetical protein [Levilinea sp.]